MRLIIFSDLHGNSYALDAFLSQIKEEPYDYLVFCGDIFGYYYDQHEIMMIIFCVCIREKSRRMTL